MIAKNGTRVLVRDLNTRQERLFVIGKDSLFQNDQVDPDSPTGKSLCGHKIDEVINLITPEGEKGSYEVLDVLKI
ncbi:MAG TPA: GreA/GreB family elongation factor [Candidatus Paceibacterota bacterium]|nr:GreA/GreB family elongation factor [Candidatus Paceibacterota bacterium]